MALAPDEFYNVKTKRRVRGTNIQVRRTKNGKLQAVGIDPSTGQKLYKFISPTKGAGLLSSLGIKTPLSNIPILGDLLF